MPKLIIIDYQWSPQPWVNTGGTRAKKYLLGPDGANYYFKRSQYKEATDTKPGKEYKFEFWSEIIAYELGTLLGFDVLEYNVALDGPIMGCICKSMINSEDEQLIEGVQFLRGFAPSYDPALKEHQERYTIHLIENALKDARLSGHFPHILETIVFDALIGNGDRHQENWAIITKQLPILEILEQAEQEGVIDGLKNWQRRIVRWLKNGLKDIHLDYFRRGKSLPKLLFDTQQKAAPIYDSGSSLGRELTEEQVLRLLHSDEDFERYLNKGKAEIRWESTKLNHFQLVSKLLHSSYKTRVREVIERVVQRWDGPRIAELIRQVDDQVPENHDHYRLSKARKDLIVKLITSRYKRLAQLIDAGI